MFSCLLHWVTAEQIDNQAQHKVQLFGTAYIWPRHCLSLICISTSPLLSFNFLPKAETCGRVNATMSWFLRCPTNSLMIEVWISNYIRSEFQITCGSWHARARLARALMPSTAGKMGIKVFNERIGLSLPNMKPSHLQMICTHITYALETSWFCERAEQI